MGFKGGLSFTWVGNRFFVLLRLASFHHCAVPYLRKPIPLGPKQEPAGRHEAPLALRGEPGRCFSRLGWGGPGTGAGIGFWSY
jgi:hypothetical protein